MGLAMAHGGLCPKKIVLEGLLNCIQYMPNWKAIKLLVFGPFVFFCGLGFNEGGIEAHTNEKNRWAIGVLHTTLTYVVGS